MSISLKRLLQVDPSPEARRLLLHVLSVGYVERDEIEEHVGHDKPGALLIWVTSGRGTLRTEDGVYQLRTGMRCWLLDLRKSRAYDTQPERKLVTHAIRFGGPAIETWLDQFSAGCEFVFRKAADLTTIRRAPRQVTELVKRRPLNYEWQIHLLLTQCLGVLLNNRRILSSPPVQIPDAVRLALDAVQAKPERNWSARELAGVAGVSYTTLRELFRDSQGETLHDYINRTRLDHARLLLCDPRLSVKDVARQLNFCSEYYFSHFFRKRAGISPSQYRLMHKA